MSYFRHCTLFHVSLKRLTFENALVKQSKRLSTQNFKHCWKCDHKIDKLSILCSVPECSMIQPFTNNNKVDYFDLFGIPRSFSVDEAVLRKKLKDLQMLLHPDKFSTKSSEEKLISQAASSYLNMAFDVSIYSSPVGRILPVDALHDR
jgi:hypothetical protein